LRRAAGGITISFETRARDMAASGKGESILLHDPKTPPEAAVIFKNKKDRRYVHETRGDQSSQP